MADSEKVSSLPSEREEELLRELQRTADMLYSACFFVTKANGLMSMLDQVDKARATLAKHGG